MVLGVIGCIILPVIDGGVGFGGDSSCGGGSSVCSRYFLLTLFCIYLCAHCVLMTYNAVC